MRTEAIAPDRHGAGGQSWLLAAVVFLVALTVRMAFLAWHGPVIVPYVPDYLPLARNLMAHGVFTLDTAPPYRPFTGHPPLYPAFLALLGWCGGLSLVGIAVVQAVMDAGASVLVLLLARMALPPRWAAGVALVYCFHLGIISSALSAMNETLFTAFLLAGVLAFAVAQSKDRPWLTALGGAGLGLATLCRPISLLLPFVLIATGMLVPGSPRQRLHGLVLIVSTALVIAPWTIRCSRLAHHLVLVQTGMSTPVYDDTPWGRISAAKTPQQLAEADRFGLREAVRRVWRAPGPYLVYRMHNYPRLFINNFGELLGINRPFREMVARGKVLRAAAYVVLMILFSLVPLLLGVVGLARARFHLVSALCASVWVYTALIHLVMWAHYRYFLPAVPFLLVNAADGAYLLAGHLAKRGQECLPDGVRLSEWGESPKPVLE